MTAWFFSPGDRLPIMRYAVSVESKSSAIFFAAVAVPVGVPEAASSSEAAEDGAPGLSEYSSSAASARFSSLRRESSSSELRESARERRDLVTPGPPEDTLE